MPRDELTQIRPLALTDCVDRADLPINLTTCLDLTSNGITFTSFTEIYHPPPALDFGAYVAYVDKSTDGSKLEVPVIVVGFRGTSNSDEQNADLQLSLVKCESVGLNWGDSCSLHSGFAKGESRTKYSSNFRVVTPPFLFLCRLRNLLLQSPPNSQPVPYRTPHRLSSNRGTQLRRGPGQHRSIRHRNQPLFFILFIPKPRFTSLHLRRTKNILIFVCVNLDATNRELVPRGKLSRSRRAAPSKFFHPWKLRTRRNPLFPIQQRNDNMQFQLYGNNSL